MSAIEQWYHGSRGHLSLNENIQCRYFFIEKTKRERERERGRKGGGNEKRFILIFCQSALEI